MAFMDFLDTKYNVFDLYPEIESFIDGKKSSHLKIVNQ